MKLNVEFICTYQSTSLPGYVNHPWRGFERTDHLRVLSSDTSLARSYLWIVPNGGHVPDLNAPFVPSLLPFLRGAWQRE